MNGRQYQYSKISNTLNFNFKGAGRLWALTQYPLRPPKLIFKSIIPITDMIIHLRVMSLCFLILNWVIEQSSQSPLKSLWLCYYLLIVILFSMAQMSKIYKLLPFYGTFKKHSTFGSNIIENDSYIELLLFPTLKSRNKSNQLLSYNL